MKFIFKKLLVHDTGWQKTEIALVRNRSSVFLEPTFISRISSICTFRAGSNFMYCTFPEHPVTFACLCLSVERLMAFLSNLIFPSYHRHPTPSMALVWLTCFMRF